MKKNVLIMKGRVHFLLFFVFSIISTLSFAQGGLIKEDTIVNKLTKCGTKADICIDNVNQSQLANAVITVNGILYTGTIAPCKVDTILAYDFSNFGASTPPPYVLDSVTINGKKFLDKPFLTFKALADSLSKWDNTSDWVYDDATKKMVGGKTTSKYSAMYISTTTIISNNTVGLNTGIQSKGVKFSFDEGSYKVVVNVTGLNIKDSVYVYVVCPKKDISTKTIKVGKTEKYCIDRKDLPAGKVTKLQNFNPIAANAPISMKILPGDSCFEVTGTKKGKDTLLFIATGLNNVQDTTIMYFNVEGSAAVLGSHIVNENVYEGQKKKYCISTDALITATGDSIQSVTNICPTKSGKDVKFTITGANSCIDMEGLKAGGLDTACIVITNNKGKSDTTTIYARVVKDCKGLIKLDSAVTYVADCSLKGQICFPDFKPADSLKYSFYADGNIYLDDKVGCDFDTIIAYNYSIMLINDNFLPPPFNVDSWTVNGVPFTGKFDKIDSLVKLMNIWDPKGKWELDTVKQLIIGGIPSQKYTPIKITNETFLVESELGFNIGLNARGLALFFEKGVHEVVITENATGCTDTIKTFVSCLKTDFISATIELGKQDTICLDIAELFSDPVKTTNIFVDSNNKNVDFSISADKKCIIFKGNVIGNDTAKIVACDKYGYCDTTYFYIDVIKGGGNPQNVTIFKDSILVGDTATYCIDTVKYLAGKKLKSFNAKSTTNYANIDLDAKNFCIKYKGIKSIGTDTSIIILCSDTKCDTFKAYITVLPAPLPKDVVLDTIPLLSTYTYCLPASKFSGVDLTKTPLTVTNTCIKTNSPVEFTIQQTANCAAPTGFGYAIVYKGNKIGKDTACVTVKDSTGKTATLKVVVYVTPRKPYVIQDTIIVKQQEIYCLDNIKLDINANIDTIWNYCPITAAPEVNFALIKAGNCKSGFGVIASGLKAGKDTACIVVKDKLGNLDSATVIITVIQPKAQSKIIYDTLVIYQNNSTCIDTVTLGVKGFVSITNICPKSSNKKAIFAVVPNGDCTVNGVKGLKISWTGAEVGTDTACWVIIDKTGKADTIRTIVTVRKPKPSVIKETIEVDGTIILCPDKTELDKSIVEIINACPLKSGSDIKIVLDTATNCVKITGLKVGIDTVCIVLVDQFDLTDTTTMIITVVPKGSILVTAIDDNQSGTKNNTIKINVLSNDKYKDSTNVKITIIPIANGGIGPNKGVVLTVDNKTGIVTYMPEFDFCGKDSFLYSLCVGSKCDTAKVIIDIKCDTSGILTIYNGFSPNGDQQNDKFVIDGIDNPTLKGNTLVIFNRWGNEVYRKTDYDNSWEGTWGGKELPDGTYYYILCYPEGDKTTVKSGFLELRR